MFGVQARTIHIGEDPRIFPGAFNYTAATAPLRAPVNDVAFRTEHVAEEFWAERARDALFFRMPFKAPERDGLARRILKQTEQGMVVVVSGLFRIGKSSLTSSLVSADHHHHCLRISVGQGSLHGADMNRTILKGFASLYPERLQDDVYREGYQASGKTESKAALFEYMSGRLSGDKKKLLLILDECSHAVSRLASAGEDFLGGVREDFKAFGSQRNIQVVLVKHPLKGADEALSCVLPPHASYTLGPFCEDSLARLVRMNVERMGGALNGEVAKMMYDFSGGRAFESRILLAKIYWERRGMTAGDPSLTVDEVSRAIDSVLEDPERSHLREFRRYQRAVQKEGPERSFWSPEGGAQYFDFPQATAHYDQGLRVCISDDERSYLIRVAAGRRAAPIPGVVKLKKLGLLDSTGQRIHGRFAEAAIRRLGRAEELPKA